MTTIQNKKFKLGDRVKTGGAYGACPSGMSGRVIKVNGSNIGVEFDKRFDGGHDCSNKGKFGYCYYMTVGSIEKLSTNQWTGQKR